ncbi:hypothetical protein [Thermoflavimicrobium daqui]|uniref:Uncharacterized protein n=1 Tax=Thermoflavimicrobium daqui TaxID=2137476 RepID=A0A364K838_9BACL|nr:hypothetical protein [Thermoflavimicrobium daqui]RAL26382.1 hypothetical protein DL897_05165 [Thermoflavimicrobium daqui]
MLDEGTPFILEVITELTRVVLFLYILAFGRKISLRSIFTTDVWTSLSQDMKKIKWQELAWHLVFFAIFAAIINGIISLITSEPIVLSFIDLTHITSFEPEEVKNAIYFVIKNMTIIPWTIVYMAYIFKLIYVRKSPKTNM